MGVITQDVEKVFPDLVTTDEQGRKMVHYEGLIAPLIEAVKELDARVSELEEQARNKDDWQPERGSGATTLSLTSAQGGKALIRYRI